MNGLRGVELTKMEREVCLLRERERGLRCLTQSRCCALRPEAELELDRVRAAIARVYEEIRTLQLHA